MNTQKATKWFGIVTLVLGIIGFIWATVIPTQYFLWVFSINTIYGLVYIISGVIAFSSKETLAMAKSYFKIMGVLYIAIAIIEVIGHGVFLKLFAVSMGDIVLHIVLAMTALYFGFRPEAEVIAVM